MWCRTHSFHGGLLRGKDTYILSLLRCAFVRLKVVPVVVDRVLATFDPTNWLVSVFSIQSVFDVSFWLSDVSGGVNH